MQKALIQHAKSRGAPRQAVGPTQPPLQWVMQAPVAGAQR